MIANFFRNLKARRVDYLLISGQATILYGAATFSEDIDLWVNPVEKNVSAFRGVLRTAGARYYKLTPPLTVEWMRRGHGFHFVLPSRSQPEIFLDLLGTPPRVGSFAASRAASQWMDTEWGKVRTIGIKDLVELKKTQRLEDYPIISNLALAWFEQARQRETRTNYRWALENIFTVEALKRFFEAHPQAFSSLPASDASGRRAFGHSVVERKEPSDAVTVTVEKWMQRRILSLQQADRKYWRRIIDELKQFRTDGQLMGEDEPV